MRSGKILIVGNDFIMPKQNSGINLNVIFTESSPVAIPVTINSVNPIPKLLPAEIKPSRKNYHKLLDYFYAHTLLSFGVLLVAIAAASQPIILSQIGNKEIPPLTLPKKTSPYGLNITVPKSQLQSWLSQYESQPASLNLGTKTATIDPSVLKNWLKISSLKGSSKVGVHVNTNLVASSLVSLADKYNVKPIDEVTITRTDGSSEIAVGGQNGSQISNASQIAAQAKDISKNLFSNKGLQLNAPLVTVPYAHLTPASFPKLIVTDINSKVMYVYQNGQIINTFLVSAGAPATPTPIGEFHIVEKLAVQDMTGFNPNGTKYFQPHVRWINYFHSGNAIHGVYWHPLSWFGVHNSSHGCVGLPDSEAKWVFDWAPIGTTVINTVN